ncbi:MAG TPA: PRC-barrel domain-containing protein [Dehalococcoidia bacterium]|nr:PRC-barrel domain-containing protein [Dehalococcoidia bacterium]
MLRSFKDTQGIAIQATDGEIGKVRDVFFDAEQWTVRYFVIDTGPWLLGRKVLIAPVAVRGLDWECRTLDVQLTKQQVKDSPDIDTDRPVSRQAEIAYHDYYRWPYYWGGGGLIGTGAYVGVAPEAYLEGKAEPEALPGTPADVASQGDPNLHSAREVAGYKIGATDDSFGSVDDFLIDDEAWLIRYLVLDSGGFLQSGQKYLVGVPWIEYVSWADRKVHVDLPRAKIEAAPVYTPDLRLDREYEERLHAHYGLPEYWREPSPRRE